MPHNAAGILTDPPVSVPKEAIVISDVKAAPDPPLEPPEIFSKFHGLWQGPKCGLLFVAPQAYSCIFNFPVKIAPASLNFSTTVASWFGTKSLWILDDIVVTSFFI